MHTGRLPYRPAGPKVDPNRVAVARNRRMAHGRLRDVRPVDLRGQVPGRSQFRHDRRTVPGVHGRSFATPYPGRAGRVRFRRHLAG